MASIIDLKVKIGSSSSVMHTLPCAIDSASPVISWELPQGIEQKRFNVKINSVNNKGLFIDGQVLSSQTSFQYPTGTQMGSGFYGLCSLEIAISEKTSGSFEYSSGELFFVFDNVLEILKVDDYYIFRWNNASDNETSWENMKYNLVVSSSIDFNSDSIIFDDLINSTSKNETSYRVKFNEKFDYVYWKVRAFDGLDYGDFTQVNAFKMTDNESPVVEIKSVEVVNDSNRDVKVTFEIKDSPKDRLNLEVYYCGGTVGTKYVLASLLNSVVSVKPGEYTIVWRSSLDEKKIAASDYRIMITAIDDEGLYGTDTSDTFSMDNLAIGADQGGEASLNNDYTVVGKMAISYWSNTSENNKVSGKMILCNGLYKEEQLKFGGKMGTFRVYRTGGLKYPLSSPDFDYDKGPDDWVFGDAGGSGGDSVEPIYPQGMILFQGSGSTGGTDLDSNDPDFIRDMLHVDENGNYWEMDERISYKSVENIRWGYARFLTLFYACSDAKCPECQGKGWKGVEEDTSLPKTYKYRYKRKVCKTCMGNRFTEPNISPEKVELTKNVDYVRKGYSIELDGGKNLLTEDFKIETHDGEVLSSSKYTIDVENKSVKFLESQRDIIIFYKMEKFKVKNTLFYVSRWIPLEKYFSPLSKIDLIHSCKIGNSKIIDPMKDFVFAPTLPSSWFSTYTYGESNSQSGYIFNAKAIPKNMYYQIDCPTLKNNMYKMSGVYNGISFIGRTGIKKITNLVNNENYRLEGYAHLDKLKLQEHVSPVSGSLTSGMKDYVPGTTYKEDVFMSGRKVPTHKWEPGLFVLTGNLHREQNLSPLRIIFLQNSWQVYNTIHWSGPSSASSMTQVQYCRVNENGSNGTFYDVIAENSDYYQEQGIWLVPPQTWHCYWKTEDQIKRDNESKYRIRIRQYNVVSKTFTQWSYSETTFMFKDSAVNPASIYYVEYRKFSKKLYVYYRLDDKDDEEFDIVSISYRVDGGDWIKINKTDIEGDIYNLSSSKGQDGTGNKHLFIWNTATYNLKASDDYRLRIEVVKTKLVAGYSRPLLKWYKTPNTTSDIQERTIDAYRGSWVKTYWDENDKIAKALNPPIFQPGRIQELEDKILEIKCQNEPLPSNCDGYFTFLHDGAVEFTRDENGKIISANVLNSAVLNSVIINGTKYELKDWLNFKIDGISRNSLIYNYTKEIEECIDIINNATNIVYEARNYTRRNLINQGYYCNGFKNNTPVYIADSSNSNSKVISDGCYFKFKVLTYFDDSTNKDGFYEPKYSEYLGDVLFTETREDVSEGGQTNIVTYSFHEYERTSDVFSRIVMDKYPRYNSQNGKPLRDFIFVDNERIATSVGGEDYMGATESGYHTAFGDNNEVASIGVANAKTEDVFTIPKNMLPGEMLGDITDTDTFEGDYRWKVSNYNLLYGRPEEKPEFSVVRSDFNRDIINIYVETKAPSNLKDAKINNIYFIDKLYDNFLIEKDCSNSLSKEYFDDNNFLYGNDIVSETVFVTDPPDEAITNGDCAEFSWTPLSKNRTRPIVLVDKFNEKLFWYLKENTYKSKIVCMAKGKTLFRVGEYDTAIPSSNNKLDEEITGAEDVISHSVVDLNGIYLMYYLVNIDGTLHPKVSTSVDGETWSYGEVYLPKGGIYNMTAIKEGEKIAIYACVYEDGNFNVYRFESLNGISFSDYSLFFSSENVISNVFVIDYNNDKIIFYTEEIHNGNEYLYTIKNNSNGIFPEIDNASNPYIIKEGLGYRMFFDRGGKIYSVFMKNYIEKNLVKDNFWLSSVVSGDLDVVRSSDTGVITMYSINRMYHSGDYYPCDDSLISMDLNNIIGWIIKGKNNSEYNIFRIEGQFLTNENKEDVLGRMDPYPFKYMYATKDLY